MSNVKTYTPKALAEEIGVDPKSLRGYLRKNHTRVAEAKNTTWIIDEDAATAAREHFAKQRAAKATTTVAA
jgi:predicted site-specific integrase-resolvase